MKLRLPSRLVQALLTTCTVALSSTPAFADVPEGYEPIIITSTYELNNYQASDYKAFIISADIIRTKLMWMRGAHQCYVDIINDTHDLCFSGVSQSYGGGAINIQQELIAEDFKELLFIENKSTDDYSGGKGGAIYGYSSSVITLSSNSRLTFSGNFCSTRGSTYGGAIFAMSSSAINLIGNEIVSFSGNYAASQRDYTGSSSFASGGAIDSAGTLNIIGNRSILFNGNYASSHDSSSGGAIYLSGNFNLIGNDHVEFRNNYEITNGSYCLRSVHLSNPILGGEKGSVKFSAFENQDIIFYDSMFVASGMRVVFNGKEEINGEFIQNATGEIVFSGAHAAEDLGKLKSNYTQQELTNSLTTTVYAITNLCGGSMNVVDGAIYKGYGISVAADSGATLRLKAGTLAQSGYSITLCDGTTLDLERENYMSASVLDMMDGSTLSFTIGESNQTTAALTLTGKFNQGGNLNITLADDGTLDHNQRYALLTLTSGENPDTWDASKVVVSGLKSDVDNLSWENGTLFFTTPTAPDLLTAIWTGARSRQWNTTDRNWKQGEYEYHYIDGVDVVFGDTASGEIELECALAPKSVLVENSVENDYTFIGEGSIAGTASLIKAGAGKLTIATANTYEGGTVINGGAVVLATSTALGTGDIQLNDGMLDMGGNTIDNNIVTEALVGYAHATIGNGATTGNLTITNTYLTVSGDAQIDGQIQANSENSITVASDATLGISKAITNAGDYLAIAGRIDISKMHGEVTGSEYRGAENSDNGFLSTTERVQVFNNTSGGDIELGNATFYHQGTQAYLDNDFKTDIQTVDYSTFYVNVDSEKLSSALDAIVELKNGTQLYVDHDTDADLLHVVSGTVTMDIAQGVTLAETDTTRTDFILQGKGRYSLMSGSTTLGAIMGNSWQGIVQINGVTFGALDFNQYGKEGSVVSMNGVTAKFVDGTKFLPTVELLGEGLSITECRTSQTYEFAGGVTGEGNLTYRLTKMPNNQTYIFTGDVSQWTGAYDSDADGKTSSLVFYGKATEMGAAILQTAGTVNVEVGDGANKHSTVFKKSVSASTLNINEKSTAVLENTAFFTDGVSLKGAINLNHQVLMEAQDANAFIAGGVEISSGKMSATRENGIAIGNVNMTTSDNFIIESANISGSLIAVGEGTRLYLVNVDIKADTRIVDDAAWLDMVATKAWLNKDNTMATGRYTTDADTTIYLSGDTAKSITLAAGTDIVELTSEMFDTVTLTGTDLWLDMTKIAGLMPNTDYITLQFKNLENALVDVENLKVYATIDGKTYRQAYTTTDFGTTTTLYFALPEPTTSTLSLLALAAIAARRRRK